MKESGMEKLIELLNEFEKEKKSGFTWRSIDSYDNCVYGVDCDGETEITMYSDLYSKYYGFIKWLVDNDKIDFDKVYEKEKAEKTDICIYGRNGTEEKTYWLLMLLSISDSPVDDLISYLR